MEREENGGRSAGWLVGGGGCGVAWSIAWDDNELRCEMVEVWKDGRRGGRESERLYKGLNNELLVFKCTFS